ncbi:NAD(P)/FAD-dependent oxidoreductase [Zongyangia hominis]|uniref:NAD(P)/FAD-dependent oxidoreductase n=1 Tax=Zongyangia hominis TaxID=2763677 RepID=A0A926E8H3_9FIRM|nr:FAD-dependent oxidoreductase [Zongyangia hominis]MBC8569825.1 NAD(P)/FAD-dependent oxidoreductase [Zongyangia hominis]
MKHIIIGAGPAGLTAAKTIRGQKEKDEILVICPEEQVHARNRLVQYLSGEKTAAQINFVEPGFFENNDIRWRKDTKVMEIRPSERRILLSDGTQECYDQLLIASGAYPAIPPVENLRQAGRVCGFRDMADADRILSQTAEGSQVVIIGSGLVGMDAAEALLHQKRQVTVVEMAGRIIPLQLDAYGASLFQKAFEDHGASFILGARVEKCLMDEEKNAVGIALGDGREIPCDLVVVAAGVRPNCAFAEGAVEIDRGVRVDARLCTSDPHIFAAGDVTGLTGTWLCAVEQGKIAGINMAGGSAFYQNAAPSRNGLHYFGRMALSIGEMDPMEDGHVLTREKNGSYQRAVVREKRLVGMLLIGNIRAGNTWAGIIERGDEVPDGEDLFQLVP